MANFYSFGESSKMDVIGTPSAVKLLEKNGIMVYTVYKYGENRESTNLQLNGVDFSFGFKDESDVLFGDFKFSGRNRNTYMMECISSCKYDEQGCAYVDKNGWVNTTVSDYIFFVDYADFYNNNYDICDVNYTTVDSLKRYMGFVTERCAGVGSVVSESNAIAEPFKRMLEFVNKVFVKNNHLKATAAIENGVCTMTFNNTTRIKRDFGFSGTLRHGRFLVLRNKGYNTLSYCAEKNNYFMCSKIPQLGVNIKKLNLE